VTDILKPRDAADVEAAVGWALAEAKTLEIVGNGSKRGIGRAAQWDLSLDLSGLSGVTLYEPQELVLSAKAGTPLKFQVAKDIVVDGSVVIARGAQVKGSIAEESRKAVLTLKKMTYEFTDVETVNRQKLKLRATPSGAAGPSRKAIEPGKKKVKDVASTAGTDYIAYLDGAQTVTMQR